MARRAAVVLLLALMPAAARAQQRPALTEDPQPTSAGHILADTGLEFGHDVFFPASGLRGDLWTLADSSVRIGVSSIAELQVEGIAWKTLTISSRQPAPLAPAVESTGSCTGGGGDVAVATKIRVMAESGRRPALGVRFATKLPVASDGSGLSLDTTDFYASVLIGRTVRGVRIAGNLGLGILADPTRADRQNDVLTYGLSLTHAVRPSANLVADINGRVSVRSTADTPVGTETGGTVRAGARFALRKGFVDAAVVLGLMDPDPDIGVSVGYSILFPAFRAP